MILGPPSFTLPHFLLSKNPSALQITIQDMMNWSPNAGFFGALFPTAMNNADEAVFSLRVIGSSDDAIKKAVEQGRIGSGLTNIELYQILHNRDWYDKTTFYDEDGVEIVLDYLGH